jgi:hypothetical protein
VRQPVFRCPRIGSISMVRSRSELAVRCSGSRHQQSEAARNRMRITVTTPPTMSGTCIPERSFLGLQATSEPPRQRHPWLIVLVILFAFMLLGIVRCVAILDSAGKALQEGATEVSTDAAASQPAEHTGTPPDRSGRAKPSPSANTRRSPAGRLRRTPALVRRSSRYRRGEERQRRHIDGLHSLQVHQPSW